MIVEWLIVIESNRIVFMTIRCKRMSRKQRCCKWMSLTRLFLCGTGDRQCENDAKRQQLAFRKIQRTRFQCSVCNPGRRDADVLAGEIARRVPVGWRAQLPHLLPVVCRFCLTWNEPPATAQSGRVSLHQTGQLCHYPRRRRLGWFPRAA